MKLFSLGINSLICKMQTEIKTKKPAQEIKADAIISAEVASYEKDPFFVRKANEAKALIEKVGLPELPKTR